MTPVAPGRGAGSRRAGGGAARAPARLPGPRPLGPRARSASSPTGRGRGDVTILGADDERGAALTTAHAARLERTHPAAEVIRIAGCGHGVHDERRYRDVFGGHLRAFLDEHAPAG